MLFPSRRFYLALIVLFLCAQRCALAAGKYGEDAPDFPIGVFTDNQQHSLEDYRGKVVVLFFYEQDCPTCRKSIPQRNAVALKYKGKPVRFFAIAAGDGLAEAQAYAGKTRLAMPVFADPLSLMEHRYGESISLKNIYQFRIIGPDGKIVGYEMKESEIDKALASAQSKYNPSDFDPKLAPVVEAMEWNDYEQAARALRPLLKKPATKEAAQKLWDALQKEGQQWLTDAESAAGENPVKAYDLYARVKSVFGSDDLGKKADEAMKGLKTNEAVKKELKARDMFAKLNAYMAKVSPANAKDVRVGASKIAKDYPDTPTGERAKAVAEELGS